MKIKHKTHQEYRQRETVLQKE